ncbi:GtrA family protein [Paenibacillus fonticola]|uniref:GtrA family protein n=1 Tax=Paenibacillus fonticola TaxID=379896 RepID=UPI00035D2A8C|nr:GtrA family protein [Paenibacillus fonticola]
MGTQSIRFIFVGVLNTIVGFAFYALFIHLLNNNYLLALIFSHIIGVTHSFLWNNRWTFQQKGYNLDSAVKFFAVYVATFAVNLFLLFLLVDTMEMNNLIAQAIALLLTTVISFFGHKYWSFRTKRKPQEV